MAGGLYRDGSSEPAVQGGKRGGRASKSRRHSKLLPLWPVGLPLPPPLPIAPAPAATGPQDVVMDEPGVVVGAKTGKPYAMINDRMDGQQESISVNPPPGAPPDPGMAPPGVVSMADGGSIYPDPYDPYGVGSTAKNLGGAGVGSMGLAGAGGNPYFDQTQMLNLQRLYRQQGTQNLDLQGAVYGAQGNAINAQRGVTAAQRAGLPLRRNAIMAEGAVTDAQGNVINATRGVIGARRAMLPAERGLISLQQEQSGARQADTMRIRNAGANVADKAAVAMESLRRGVEDQNIYARLGVAAPVEIDTPVTGMQTAPGTRAKLVDQEGRMREQAEANEQDRGFVLERAKLALALMNTNVDEANLVLQEAGLTVDQARQMVSRANQAVELQGLDVDAARFNAAEAGYGVDEADLALDRGQLSGARIKDSLGYLGAPEDEGYKLYTDPRTLQRRWVTPSEADELAFDYSTTLSRRRIPTQVETERLRSRASIPSQIETAQAREHAQNNIRPLAGANEATLLQTLGMGGGSQLDSSEAGSANPFIQDVLNELIARTGNEMIARYQLGLLLEKARLAKEKAGGGLPAVAISVP